jgi:hypothetical protein
VIPGAVAVNHTAAGTVRELTTNSAGAYVAAALAPGQYNLTFAASGFRMYQAQGVTQRVAQNGRIDVRLQVGSETSRLRYRAEGLVQVDTESSQLGGTITARNWCSCVNFNMSIYKAFRPTEKFNLQFRAEAFNIFNHTEWTGVNNYVSTPNLMFSTGAHTPRVLQFALQLTF